MRFLSLYSGALRRNRNAPTRIHDVFEKNHEDITLNHHSTVVEAFDNNALD